MFNKPNQQFIYVCTVTGVFLYVGAYFCVGAYKCDVVVVIRMGAYIHGVLILCGWLLSRFYGMSLASYM